MKMYFPRYGAEQKKEAFWDLLDKLKTQSVKCKCKWEDFYYSTIFIMEDGRQYLYLEDTEYGIPYSIEWL